MQGPGRPSQAQIRTTTGRREVLIRSRMERLHVSLVPSLFVGTSSEEMQSRTECVRPAGMPMYRIDCWVHRLAHVHVYIIGMVFITACLITF